MKRFIPTVNEHASLQELSLNPSLHVDYTGPAILYGTYSNGLFSAWLGTSTTHDVQYLRVFIGQLRHKIEFDPSDPALILTESGIGYRFSGEPGFQHH